MNLCYYHRVKIIFIWLWLIVKWERLVRTDVQSTVDNPWWKPVLFRGEMSTTGQLQVRRRCEFFWSESGEHSHLQEGPQWSQQSLWSSVSQLPWCLPAIYTVLQVTSTELAWHMGLHRSRRLKDKSPISQTNVDSHDRSEILDIRLIIIIIY